MPTFYRPTERRGRRILYRSIDPVESRTRRKAVLLFFAIAVLLVGLVIGLSN